MSDKFGSISEVLKDQKEQFKIIVKNIRKSINTLKLEIRPTKQEVPYKKIQPIIIGEWFDKELLELYIHWQVRTEEFLRQLTNETLLDRFVRSTSPSGEKSLWIMLMGDRPWSFTDWGFASLTEDNVEKIYQNHYDDYYFLSEINSEHSTIQIVTDRVKKGYLKKLNRFQIEIDAILNSPSLIQQAKDVIESIQMNNLITKREEILNLASDQIKTNSPNGLVIGSFLIRYVLEDMFKTQYKKFLEGKSNSTLGKLIIHLFKIGKILEDDKETLLSINNGLNQIIHPQNDNGKKPSSDDILAMIPKVKKYLTKYGDNL